MFWQKQRHTLAGNALLSFQNVQSLQLCSDLKNFFFDIKVHYILNSYAVKTFVFFIFVLIIFLLTVLIHALAYREFLTNDPRLLAFNQLESSLVIGAICKNKHLCWLANLFCGQTLPFFQNKYKK